MIKFKHEIEWFQKVYLIADPEQNPWLIVGVNLSPIGAMFEVSRMGETIAVYDGEFTIAENTNLRLGIPDKE
jgi:hypothetical protein